MNKEVRHNGKMNRHVLVLNQSYEPLHICNMKRAVVLIFLGKAQAIEHFDDEIHSISYTMQMPSVVRLESYVNLPVDDIVLTRKNVIKRDSHTCQYCGAKGVPLTLDHIVPKVRGGSDTWENLACACVRCNSIKGNRTPREAKMKLLSKPRRPNRITFIQRFVKSPFRQWRPYLFLD